MRWVSFEIVLPVLTLAIGYSGTFVTERFRDRSATRRACRPWPSPSSSGR